VVERVVHDLFVDLLVMAGKGLVDYLVDEVGVAQHIERVLDPLGLHRVESVADLDQLINEILRFRVKGLEFVALGRLRAVQDLRELFGIKEL
jgi:hypothetical protein